MRSPSATRVAVLFAATPSVYDALPGVVVFDKRRDARSFAGGMPVVAHPPCRAWGGLSHMAKPLPGERELAPWAVEQVRTCGGVLEHPRRSALWAACGLPMPGAGRDAFGGWTLGIHQSWLGHRAEKASLLYIVGVEPRDVPALPLSLSYAEFIIGTTGRRRDGTRAPKRPEISKVEREITPRPLAEWLVAVARLTSGRVSTRTRSAAARFFLRIDQAGQAAPKRDEYTLELFGLSDYLECEGMLARELAYLRKCEAVIRDAAELMR